MSEIDHAPPPDALRVGRVAGGPLYLTWGWSAVGAPPVAVAI